MQIYYDQEYSQELTKKLRYKFLEEVQDRKVVHLSDTTKCPLKCWNRLVGITPSEVDDRGIGMMMIGIVGQEIFQALYPPEWTEYEPTPDMPAHIDIFVQNPEKMFPVEIKWSRKNVNRAKDIGPSWIMQTTGYMALTNQNEGKLVVFNVIYAKINCFRFVMTDDELVLRRFQIDEIKANILKAVEEKNPNLLEPWENECKYCDFKPSRKRKKAGLSEGCPRVDGKKATGKLDQYLSDT